MERFMISENTNKSKLDKKVLIIFMIMFTEILGFSIVMPVIPFLGLSLGLNAFQIGLVLSIFRQLPYIFQFYLLVIIAKPMCSL